MSTPYVNPNGVTGYGVMLGYAPPGTGATGTFAYLTIIETITPIGSDVPKAEATLLASKVKVNNAGVPELTSSCKVRYDPTDVALRTVEQETWQAPVPSHDFQIKDINGASVTWTGFINSFKPDEYTTDETRTASLEFVINTVPIYTAAPSS